MIAVVFARLAVIDVVRRRPGVLMNPVAVLDGWMNSAHCRRRSSPLALSFPLNYVQFFLKRPD